MSKDITIHDLKDLVPALMSQIEETIGADKLDALAMEARDIIIERTRKGQSAGGTDLQPYSTKPCYISKSHRPAPQGGMKTPRTLRKIAKYTKAHKLPVSYRRFTSRGGKSIYYERGYDEFKRKTTGTGVPNLTGTGRMFNSLVMRRTDAKTRTLYFATATQNDKAVGNDAKRHFFDVGLVSVERERLNRLWESLNGQ